MESELKRKEVWLHVTVTGRLQALADRKGWSLKQYMEWVLAKESGKAMKIHSTSYQEGMTEMLGSAMKESNKKKK